MGTGKVSTGTPTRLRSFDPVRLAALEYRAWTGYYLRNWPQVLRASFDLVRLGSPSTTRARLVARERDRATAGWPAGGIPPH